MRFDEFKLVEEAARNLVVPDSTGKNHTIKGIKVTPGKNARLQQILKNNPGLSENTKSQIVKQIALNQNTPIPKGNVFKRIFNQLGKFFKGINPLARLPGANIMSGSTALNQGEDAWVEASKELWELDKKNGTQNWYDFTGDPKPEPKADGRTDVAEPDYSSGNSYSFDDQFDYENNGRNLPPGSKVNIPRPDGTIKRFVTTDDGKLTLDVSALPKPKPEPPKPDKKPDKPLTPQNPQPNKPQKPLPRPDNDPAPAKPEKPPAKPPITPTDPQPGKPKPDPQKPANDPEPPKEKPEKPADKPEPGDKPAEKPKPDGRPSWWPDWLPWKDSPKPEKPGKPDKTDPDAPVSPDWSKPGPGTRPSTKPGTKPGTKPNTKPETKPDNKPDNKPDSKPEPSTKPNTKPEPSVKPNTKPEPSTKPNLAPEPSVKPQAKPQQKPQTPPVRPQRPPVRPVTPPPIVVPPFTRDYDPKTDKDIIYKGGDAPKSMSTFKARDIDYQKELERIKKLLG